jgi:hypothetical protein
MMIKRRSNDVASLWTCKVTLDVIFSCCVYTCALAERRDVHVDDFPQQLGKPFLHAPSESLRLGLYDQAVGVWSGITDWMPIPVCRRHRSRPEGQAFPAKWGASWPALFFTRSTGYRAAGTRTVEATWKSGVYVLGGPVP